MCSMGSVIICGLFYFIRNWRVVFVIAVTVPSVVSLVCTYFFII